MRVIKFRGKYVKDQQWIYGGYGDSKYGKVYITCRRAFFNVDPETVGQFTGVYDVNSKEIYEGDIIDHTGGRDYPLISVVKWFGEAAQWTLLNGGDHITFWPPFANSEYKVIGNVHDNPELLEGESE